MKHILLISILLLFVHIDLQGQPCIEPIDNTVHKYKQLIIHGTHDNIFWSGDTLNILLEEIDHVTYNIVDNVPTFYNDPGIDTWIQCRLDTGATPAQLINEAVKAEPVIHHLMGKIYQGGLIFHMSPSGGGLVAHTSDASTTKNWFDAVTYCNTLSVTDAFSVTYTDWKLPNKQELNEMYQNLKKKGVGGFASSSYWSSTESGFSIAWFQYFGSGLQANYGLKYDTYYVRAVRAF